MIEETNVTTSSENGEVANATEESVKTYTQEEVLALLQSETDRRV